MQSDKHLNNVQTLQNGGSEVQYNHNHANPVSSASLGGGCGAPSPSKPKQKPTWRCEVMKQSVIVELWSQHTNLLISTSTQ